MVIKSISLSRCTLIYRKYIANIKNAKKFAKKFKKRLTNVIFRDIIDKHSNERARKQRVLEKV